MMGALRARRSPVLAVLAVAVAALAAVQAPAAGARTLPAQQPFRVLVLPHLTDSQLRALAKQGAVGLLVPGVGPTTNRRRALAGLVRGEQVNARLGGVPSGAPLIATTAATGTPTGHPVIAVTLPPRGRPVPNDRRYRIVVLGRGYSGLLESRTTRIPGLVSIVDIAPTALGRSKGSLLSTASHDPVVALKSLDRQIHSSNRLKFAVLMIVAGMAGLLALLYPAAALLAIPAALLTSLAVGASGSGNEVFVCAAMSIGTLLGGVALARVCRSEGSLLALLLFVLALHLVLLSAAPDVVALSPLGPTQNSRFWGVGNQLETMLLIPALVGAALAGKRFGLPGFVFVAALAVVTVAGNGFGADGGGAIVLGVAFAFLGSGLGRVGLRGHMVSLLCASTAVLGLVWYDLRAGGPDHLRSAFSHGLGGLLAVATNRVPLAYEPALHHWYLLLPFGLLFVAVLALVLRRSVTTGRRELVWAFALAIGVSLLVNDSAAYVLIGGTAGLAALAASRWTYGPMARVALESPRIRVRALEAEASSTD
jgi:hypothetical protein